MVALVAAFSIWSIKSNLVQTSSIEILQFTRKMTKERFICTFIFLLCLARGFYKETYNHNAVLWFQKAHIIYYWLNEACLYRWVLEMHGITLEALLGRSWWWQNGFTKKKAERRRNSQQNFLRAEWARDPYIRWLYFIFWLAAWALSDRHSQCGALRLAEAQLQWGCSFFHCITFLPAVDAANLQQLVHQKIHALKSWSPFKS